MIDWWGMLTWRDRPGGGEYNFNENMYMLSSRTSFDTISLFDKNNIVMNTTDRSQNLE